jgi:hypothetical protein
MPVAPPAVTLIVESESKETVPPVLPLMKRPVPVPAVLLMGVLVKLIVPFPVWRLTAVPLVDAAIVFWSTVVVPVMPELVRAEAAGRRQCPSPSCRCRGRRRP